jgi:tRNA pseudouridine65 synthase
MLEIIYQDEHLVAINKPHGLLVHQSPIARNAEEFALQLLRDQIQQHVWPAHRLDRKTSGLILFSLNKDTDRLMQQQFMENKVQKKYLALLRGHSPDELLIDYPLKKENGTLQDAITYFKTLARTEVSLAVGKHPTSRYSLVEAQPQTGRMHQLRRHFAHIFHPIIGDRPHGCNKQNKFFKERFQMESMLLHASELQFTHPLTLQEIHLKAHIHPEFKRTLNLLEIAYPS